MLLTQEALNEFKAIYQRQFGEEISDDQAREMGSRLLRVFRVLLDMSDQASADESPKDRQPNDLPPAPR